MTPDEINKAIVATERDIDDEPTDENMALCVELGKAILDAPLTNRAYFLGLAHIAEVLRTAHGEDYDNDRVRAEGAALCEDLVIAEEDAYDKINKDRKKCTPTY